MGYEDDKSTCQTVAVVYHEYLLKVGHCIFRVTRNQISVAHDFNFYQKTIKDGS